MPDSPPIILDAQTIDSLLPHLDTLATMRALFAELGKGNAVQPRQTLALLPQQQGDFILYSGAMTEPPVLGVKISPYIVAADRPVITAWTLLLSARTGKPLVLCDAGRLTTERTAATTALAVDLLARRDARRLAIIGAGPVATAHMRHVIGLRDWSGIKVFSRGLQNDETRCAAWQKDPRVLVSSSARDCVAQTDVVLLATCSGTPVIDPDWLGPETLVTSISTNAHEAHEVPPAFLSQAQVYCDDADGTPSSAGEMVIARRDLGWNPSQIRGDLAGLCSGKAPLPEAGRRVFFRSIGLGLEDIAIAHAVWQLAQNEGQAR